MASWISLIGCTTPVSLLANMTVTRQDSGRRASDTEETSTEPVDADTGTIVKSGSSEINGVSRHEHITII